MNICDISVGYNCILRLIRKESDLCIDRLLLISKMAVQAPRKGYQDNFIHQSPEETDIECPVCLNVLCEPKLAACCGRSVCAACIDQIDSGEKPCPMCSQQMKLVDDKCLE